MAEKDYKIKDLMQKYDAKRLVVLGWIKKGLFPNARLETEPLPYWIIPEEDLKNFVPPPVKVGRPRDLNPSKEAEAKRRQREQKEGNND